MGRRPEVIVRQSRWVEAEDMAGSEGNLTGVAYSEGLAGEAGQEPTRKEICREFNRIRREYRRYEGLIESPRSV